MFLERAYYGLIVREGVQKQSVYSDAAIGGWGQHHYWGLGVGNVGAGAGGQEGGQGARAEGRKEAYCGHCLRRVAQ